MRRASWDPHNTNRIAVTVGRDGALLDVRCSTVSNTDDDDPSASGGASTRGVVGGLQNCHRFGVSDVNHNPNLPHTLTTCGRDGSIKFWDVRKKGGAHDYGDDKSLLSVFGEGDGHRTSRSPSPTATNTNEWGRGRRGTPR